MSDSHTLNFGSKAKSSHRSPLEKVHHREMDTTNFIDANEIQQCQYLICALQWIASLGMININTSSMTLPYFRVELRVG